MQTEGLPVMQSTTSKHTNQLQASNDFVLEAYDSIKKLLADVQMAAQNIFGDVTDWFTEDMTTTDIFQRITSHLLQGIVKVVEYRVPCPTCNSPLEVGDPNPPPTKTRCCMHVNHIN